MAGSLQRVPGELERVPPVVHRHLHPNPALLSRLSRDGARVLRTDITGDIAIVLTPRGIATVGRGRS